MTMSHERLLPQDDTMSPRHPAPRRARRALLGALAACAVVAAGSSAAGQSFEKAHAVRIRLVCRIPSSGNAQRMLGFDGGFSFTYGGVSFWSTGDSAIDGNGDGIENDLFGFHPGTIGRTTDLRAGNCIDVRLRTRTGREVLPIFVPDRANGECTFWPGKVFEADHKLYFFFGALWKKPDCGESRPETYGIGLGQLTSPSSNELGPVRIGDQGWKYAQSPIKIGNRVYTFSSSTDGALRAARVDERFVPSRDLYEYWNGSTWTSAESAAQPIAQLGELYGAPNVDYNAYLGRYVILHACGGLHSVCLRTAMQPGPDASALENGFNDPTTLFTPGLAAHLVLHGDYKDPAHPERIYVTTGRFPGRAYFLSLWEIDLGAQPPPATRSFHAAAWELYNGAGTGGWNYASYDLAQPGAGLVTLTTPGQGQKGFRDKPLNGFVGDEMVGDDVMAPGAFASGAWPSATRGGAIVWTAPGNGTIAVSGSMWLENTLGDNVLADVVIVRGASVLPIWSKRLVAKWHKTRQRRLNRGGIGVLAGDRVLFGVRKGRSTSNAFNDLTFIEPTITFDAQ